MQSFITYSNTSDFSIQNIPFGVALFNQELPACVTRVGDTLIDLSVLYERGYFKDFDIEENVFEAFVLNPFMELGKDITKPVREHIQRLLLAGSALDQDNNTKDLALHPAKEAEMLMPVHVPNYTDFYSSIEHATNVGVMFRGKENALMPNWKHIPVGYHGRSSSIIPSGTPIRRPHGQQLPNGEESPVFGPSKLLDFELEMAFITNQYTQIGEPIAAKNAEDYIFGMLLFNDWSARDIQKWEYVPLGPFLGKNFASSVSPWVVTLEALTPFRVQGPTQEPTPLPYLQTNGKKNIDIDLQVFIQPKDGSEQLVSHSNFKYMYWNMSQQLAHHTINGCNIEVGDMYGSGTISGPTPDSYGSMLELTWRGEKPIKMNDGTQRKFIQDNDTVIMRAWCQNQHFRVGFGELSTQVLPAIDLDGF